MDKPSPSEVSNGEMILAVCAYCLHGRNDGTCVAYPDGIPFRILGADAGHDTIQPDQRGGTVFEQNPNLPDLPEWNQLP
jgi:hypothetical protein